MTTSTAKKKKGPIRWGAVIPAVVITTLVALYGKYAFDNHLRKSIIWTSEYFYGAEINIADLKTSLFSGNLQIKGIQITDKDKPERNLVSIGKVQFHLLISELLKAKFIVDLGEVSNIEWHSQRKKPGKLYPKKKEKSPQLKKIEDTALKVASENLEGNALGNVANVLGGSNVKTEIKEIKSELYTEKKIKELEKELKEKEAYYKNKIEKLKDSGKLKNLNERIKSYKWDKKNPLKSLSEANKLIKDASSTYKEYEREIRNLRDDVKKLEQTSQNFDQWIEKDMESLQAMAGVPTLDPEKIAYSLVGEVFGENVTTIRKYSEIAKEYMPPPKSERSPQDQLIPRQRGEGTTYTFEVPGTNPKLWIKKIMISSKANQSKYSGNLQGKISNITNAPKVTGKPISFELAGEFPNQQLYGLNIQGNLNHHQKEATQDFNLSVNQFPFPERRLSKSKDLGITLMDQVGRLSLTGNKKDKNVGVTLSTSLPDPKFQVESPKKLVKEVVGNSLARMNEVTMNASANGEWESLKWKFRSNIADELSKGLKAEIDNQVKVAKDKLRQKLMAKIGPLKEKYKKEIDSVKNGLDKELKEQEDKIKNESKEVLSKLKDQQKNETKEKTKKLEKEAKKFLKKLF